MCTLLLVVLILLARRRARGEQGLSGNDSPLGAAGISSLDVCLCLCLCLCLSWGGRIRRLASSVFFRFRILLPPNRVVMNRRAPLHHSVVPPGPTPHHYFPVPLDAERTSVFFHTTHNQANPSPSSLALASPSYRVVSGSSLVWVVGGHRA